MKKLISTISVLILCVCLVLTSLSVTTSVSKPSKPKGFKITSYNPMYNTATVTLKEKIKLNYELKVYNYKNKLKQTIKIPVKNFFGEYKKRFPYKIKNIKSHSNPQFYKIVARSYKNNKGKKIYSTKSKSVYACQGFRCDLDWNTMTIKWDKVKGATRYKVLASTKNETNKFFTLTTTKGTSYKLNSSNLARLGKNFNAKIIAQKRVGKKYYSSDSWECVLWYL